MHSHLEYLADKVFHVRDRWPHYRLLLEDMQGLHEKYRDAKVLSLERSISDTCGAPIAESRWLPLFNDITVINHGLYDSRYSYFVHDRAIVGRPWDLIINPNLLHHVRDQAGLFAAMCHSMDPHTELYIFDTPLREVHDCPGDYVRYTPYGIRDMLDRNGIAVNELKEVVNHWEAVMYCLGFSGQVDKQDPHMAMLKGMIAERAAAVSTVSSATGRRMCMAWSVMGTRR